MQTSLVERWDAELVDMEATLRNTEAKLDELVESRDQQVGRSEKELANVRAELEANVSELEAVRLRLSDAEAGADKLRAKLEAKESELEAVRLRLSDAEAEADKLRTQTATGSVNRDEEQVTRRLMERMRAFEAEMMSKRWNEKSIEDMECSNEG
jgi:predicted  nucleic acid-binding Zn-ribbon protein